MDLGSLSDLITAAGGAAVIIGGRALFLSPERRTMSNIERLSKLSTGLPPEAGQDELQGLILSEVKHLEVLRANRLNRWVTVFRWTLVVLLGLSVVIAILGAFTEGSVQNGGFTLSYYVLVGLVVVTGVAFLAGVIRRETRVAEAEAEAAALADIPNAPPSTSKLQVFRGNIVRLSAMLTGDRPLLLERPPTGEHDPSPGANA